MQGYYYTKFDVATGQEVLRGMKWGSEFIGKGTEGDYQIDSLFLNGAKIDNIVGHIDGLTSKSK